MNVKTSTSHCTQNISFGCSPVENDPWVGEFVSRNVSSGVCVFVSDRVCARVYVWVCARACGCCVCGWRRETYKFKTQVPNVPVPEPIANGEKVCTCFRAEAKAITYRCENVEIPWKHWCNYTQRPPLTPLLQTYRCLIKTRGGTVVFTQPPQARDAGGSSGLWKAQVTWYKYPS